tara:strand:- start:2055 stop:2870 length:816 start_codon:yes stop_codon:yes gene_type:complete
MCGCFDVGFHFAETFSYSEDTNYMPSKIKHAGALEFAQLVEETEDKVVIQHLLIVGSEESPYIIKHWRQDWIYENNDFYMFNHDNKWTYKNINDNNVKGQWTQKVYQVDDSPRYEGTASWVHVDGKHYWENTTDAPLPRREYTKRSDYNVTIRTNRHEIVNKGWVHDQDNKKIIRETGKEDIILAEEKGINNYDRVDESKCKAAAEWWQENKDFWKQVRISWDEIYGLNKNLELKDKVEGKRLYDVLFGMDVKTSKKKINKTIESYVKEDS